MCTEFPRTKVLSRRGTITILLILCICCLISSHLKAQSFGTYNPPSGCLGTGACVDAFDGAAGMSVTLHNSNWKRATGSFSAYLTGRNTLGVAPRTAARYYMDASMSDTAQVTIPASADAFIRDREACVRMQRGVPGYCIGFGKVKNGVYAGCQIEKAGYPLAEANCGSASSLVSHTLAITASGQSPVTLQIYLDGVAVSTVSDSKDVYGQAHPGFALVDRGIQTDTSIAMWRDSNTVIDAADTSAPLFVPAAGTYTSVQKVNIVSPTPGAALFYTLDGTTPTTASLQYLGPIKVAANTTIRAIAYKLGEHPSTVMDSAYTIGTAPVARPSVVAAPVFSIPSPYSGAATSVSISDATSQARVLYCMDASNTCTPSLLYTGPVNFATTGYIRAQGILNGWTPSPVASWQGSWGSVQISTATCPGGKQYQVYQGCTITATGGLLPYTFGWSKTSGNGLIEGLTLDPVTGVVSGKIYGQGVYNIPFTVTDATKTTVTKFITIAADGDNTLAGCSLFPADSVWHLNVANLPVDTSVAAPIPSFYLNSSLHMVFGQNVDDGGIPIFRVPYDQANVPVSTTAYQSYFTSAPFPAYAPIEGTMNSGPNADRHVSIVQTAGGGHNCRLWEMWQGAPTASGWTDASNAYWDLGSYDMLPQDNGSTDAAGLPIAPLVWNYDEVAGGCAQGAECGVVMHPARFTLNHTLGYHVWPATAQAGLSYCTGGYQDDGKLLSQSAPPAFCGFSAPMGEIYRLKRNTPSPASCAGHSQAQVLLTAMRNYGLILADNGITGGIVATADARWNDSDLACLADLKLADFEPVDVSSKMIDVNSSQVRQ